MLAGIVEFLGWFGAVTVLAGYILFSTGKIPNGPLYQLFNLVGGLSVAINVAAHHAIPSTIVNGIWAIVAVVVLVKMAKARRAAKRGEPVVVDQSVLHTEPPATTAVLPVIGPALRDHEADDAEPAVAPARADAAPVVHTPGPAEVTSATEAEPRLQADAVASSAAAPTAAAPMTESIPVITATIALALVAAAQEQADATGSDQSGGSEQVDAGTVSAAEQDPTRDAAPGIATH